MTKISPHLWYTDKADAAARFYAAIFPDSRVESVIPIAADTPMAKFDIAELERVSAG